MINSKEKFINYLQSIKNSSEHTVRNYSLDIQSLIDFACQESINKKHEEQEQNSEYNISSLDRRTIRNFLSFLTSKGNSKRSIARKISSLRSFFKYCIKHNILESNPIEFVESPKQTKKLPPSLTYCQIKILLEQPNTKNILGFRDRCIMELFYSSGIRISELVNLNKNDINYSESYLLAKGKGKKERIVPITKNALNWIENYLNHEDRDNKSDAIFLNKFGDRITVRSIDRSFKNYLNSSDLPINVTPHTIRHTIATHWLENGMNVKTIQLLLGHSSLSTTCLYAHVSKTLQKETHSKLHPRN